MWPPSERLTHFEVSLSRLNISLMKASGRIRHRKRDPIDDSNGSPFCSAHGPSKAGLGTQ